MSTVKNDRLGDIRLIAVDIDGTLVRSDGKVSLRTRISLWRAQRAGIAIAIATGRPPRFAERFSRSLWLNGPVISSDGAMATDKPGGEEILNEPFESQALSWLLSYVRERGLYFHVQDKEGVAVEKSCSEEAKKLLRSRLHARVPIKIVPDNSLEDDPNRVLKLCLKCDRSASSGIMRDLNSLANGKFRPVRTSPSYIEITKGGVSKGAALEVVCGKLGISLDRVAAVGDSANDIEMLQTVGIGVAMANASPELSLAADRFTYSNDEDGVSSFIYEVIRAKRR